MNTVTTCPTRTSLWWKQKSHTPFAGNFLLKAQKTVLPNWLFLAFFGLVAFVPEVMGQCDPTQTVPEYNINLTPGNPTVTGSYALGDECCSSQQGNNSCLVFNIDVTGFDGLAFCFDPPCSIEGFVLDSGMSACTNNQLNTGPGINLCREEICVPAGATMIELLVCKPGAANNLLDISILGIPSLTLEVEDIVEGCNDVFVVNGTQIPQCGNGANNVTFATPTITWSSTDDPTLQYLDISDPENAIFNYTGPTVTDCNGIDFDYTITTNASTLSDCITTNPSVTKTATVFPALDGQIVPTCNLITGTVELCFDFDSGVVCPQVTYSWMPGGATSRCITVSADDTQYTVDVARNDVPLAPGCIPFVASAPASCCTQDADCMADLDVIQEGCASDIPDPFTDPADVFDPIESCGATVTMDFIVLAGGDQDFCTDGDGVDFTRRYRLFFDGVIFVTCDQTITIDDTTPPSITCPADATVECGMSTAPAATGTATGNDACGGVTITFSDTSVPGCGNTETITRTWTATDDCGNPNTCTQIITVLDTRPPSITCPADATVECGMSTAPAATGMATGSDGCGTVAITFSDSFTPACGNTGTITRTWTATDQCGNPSTCVQIITVVDTTPPSITCPADATVECGMSTAPAATGMATGSDGCGTVAITFSDSFAPACGNTGTITRTWTATDQCGNPSTCVQIITVVDTTPPSIICPADATVECGMSTAPAATGMATGSDICGTVTITFSDSFAPACGNTGVITRTWTATDQCGNPSTCVQTITIIDTTDPVITGPVADGATMNVECNLRDPNWTPFMITTDDLTITDNCSARPDITVTYEDILEEEGECGVSDFLSLWRCVWTATDECGNSTTYTVFLRIVDTQGPVFTFFPPNVGIECDEAVPFQQATAEDACSEVAVSFVDSRINGDCANNYTIRRRWTAVDGCGNPTVQDQLIDVSDTTPPVLTFTDEYVSNYTDGQEVYVDCGDFSKITKLKYATHAYDNCSGERDVDFEYEDFGLFSCAEDGYMGHLVTRWTATDDCGNTSTVTLSWFLTDNTPPVLQGVPADACVNSLPPVPNVQAVDDCEFAVLEFNQSDPVDCAGGQYVERTWTATDVCGNTISATQRLTLNDNNGPTINIDYPGLAGLPSGSTVQLPAACNEEGDLQVPDLVAAVNVGDGCGSSDFRADLQLVSMGTCRTNGYLARYQLIVTAVDLCDNASGYELFLELIDTTPPVVLSPAELILACGEAIPELEATDGCGQIASITFVDSQPIVASCADNPQSFERIWTITDACDNSVLFAQSITIIDEEGPIFRNVPADACNDLSIPLPVTAFDECSGTNLPVNLNEVTTNEAGCGQVLTRTWTATDACGNTSVATQQVFFTDDTAPVLSFNHPLLVGLEDSDELILPVDFNFGNPQDIYDFGDNPLVIDDNCASNLEAVLSMAFLDDEEDCAATGYLDRILLTWTVTDPCGNSAKISIILIYVDTYGPEIFHVPANLVLYCDDPIPAPAEVFLKDNYDQDITLIFEEEELPTDFGLRIVRRWTAIDDCGNTTVEEQYIDIYGNTLACAFDVPEDLFCNTSGNEISVIASGGTAPYTYSWEMTDCDGFLTSDPTNATVTYTVGFTTQNFSVTITDANGCQRVCTTSVVCEKLETENVPSFGESEGEGVFNVYPNPVDHNLRVKASALTEKPVAISIYSLYGQVMFQKELPYWPQEGYDIDTKGLPNGTYIIKLETEGLNPLVQQVIVLH